MGYATLDSTLAFPNNVPPNNSSILVIDTLKSEGNFLIHHFVINHLKANKPVILVGLSQIFNHYFLIARKLGVNLQTYKQTGKLLFIDGLTHLNEYTNDTPYPPSKTPTAPSGTLEYKDDLKLFYKTIQNFVSQDVLLIIDDLSVLLYNGFKGVEHFVSKLKTMMEGVNGTLLSVVHADEEGSEDVEQDNFIKNVIYGSDLILQVQPLHSGLARDVHGQLDIIHGPQAALNINPQSLHYKILDNNVHFFAKGLQQNVL
ncbi:hypothetical protein G6F37_012740 [Rhizopus arrhizus]|nr:hypothetical protein G6F38_012091 [Rhizopus arrhizus]KAG1141875.1 hypothetical protein G6F37_012740 [Rhizopus arrhizus]